MQVEEIFLHCVRVILLILSLIFLNLIWKYLNKKPLGMQTILDQVIKDYIRLGIMGVIPSFLVTLKFVKSYAKPTAMAILKIYHFTRLTFVWQLFVTLTIRYILHQLEIKF